jgi:hypothetical protein
MTLVKATAVWSPNRLPRVSASAKCLDTRAYGEYFTRSFKGGVFLRLPEKAGPL